MQDLTFGEQVKIILSRKDMTIKELARKIEARTGKKMSRQNLTQRLGRDNFQEQDMRMIAEILGCPFYLNILDESISAEKAEDEVKAGQNPKIVPEAADVQKEMIAAETGQADIQKTAAEAAAGEAKPKEGVAAKESAVKEETPEDKASGGMANERDITIGELVEIHKKLDVLENSVGKGADPEEEKAESGEYVKEEKADVQAVEVHEEYTGNQPGENPEGEKEQGYSEYPEFKEEYALGEEPVEKILEEIETLEKEEKDEEKPEEKSEEKPHGWRAYFKQRFKKLGKGTLEQEAEDGYNKDVQEQPAKEAYPGNGQEQPAEEMYPGNEQEQPTESIYPGEEYPQNGYIEENYMSGEYTEAGYKEDVYIREEYMETDYGTADEDAYSELPEEEDTFRGELNPYTGKEYESNSVRMHPSRIGYVQVYDRENHQWTDMTEWAFLGYQERKKQLLGKDYDPPIYLD